MQRCIKQTRYGGKALNNFSRIKEALEYIDSHLDENISLKIISGKFNFSPYYFHRMFSIIVGKTIAAHIRDRRLQSACVKLSSADKSVLSIGLECGYDSAQSFSRAFRQMYGLSPSEYRKQGLKPFVVSIDEMIMKFTNRLKGGIYLNPKIIKQDKLMIACISGDGDETGAAWDAFMSLNKNKPLENKLSDNGYEVRVHDGDICTVYVGLAVSSDKVDAEYEIFKLPASAYASFDVYVANGYDSENKAMNEWLQTNEEKYTERLLNGKHYCVEYYDERFKGSEAGSIVEIWVPIEKR
jgi:AraC-like DNA-binding protein/predicted transcriptional regulator YdeE